MMILMKMRMSIGIKKTKLNLLSSAGCGDIVIEAPKGTPGEVVESTTSWSKDRSYKIIMNLSLFYFENVEANNIHVHVYIFDL